MFLFGSKSAPKLPEKVKAQPSEPTSNLKRDTLILDYLSKIDANSHQFRALYVYISKLKSAKLKSLQRQNLIETFENVTQKNGGEIFGLPNEDMVVFFNKKASEEIQACLIKVRFIFHDDPFLANAFDLEQAGFVKFFDLATEKGEFKSVIRNVMDSLSQNQNFSPSAGGRANPQNTSPAMNASRKLRRELTPNMLAKVQKALLMADFASLIRRQSVCAVIGKSPPQMIFDEVFVSIADLRDTLLPDVDLTANPWLFLHLTETLDKRVLASVGQHDDGSLNSNFSLNLNVSTILSDDFLAFDDNINPSMRSTIVLELQLVDILNDIKAFILAKTFAQYRGYKICIDGITVDKLKYIDREQLDGDLLKIIWHPSFMDMIKEDTHFTDYVNRAERAKMILCRVDDPNAVDIGNSLGINLYQGRYIQRLLAAQPKKTIFKIK